jgi:hypothetical protein
MDITHLHYLASDLVSHEARGGDSSTSRGTAILDTAMDCGGVPALRVFWAEVDRLRVIQDEERRQDGSARAAEERLNREERRRHALATGDARGLRCDD